MPITPAPTYSAKGYTAVADVATYLGRTLTDAQMAYAQNMLLPVAEAYIDRETLRTWLTGPITAESYRLRSPRIVLRTRPVTSIQLIQTRTTQVGDVPVTLTAGVDYELLNASRGDVRFAGGYGISEAVFVDRSRLSSYDDGNPIALISYTPVPTVPADIYRAATMIVGRSLQLALFPDRYGIARLQLDSSTSIQYVHDGMTLEVPEPAQRILAKYRSGRLIIA